MTDDMCSGCQALVGKGRHTSPHVKLRTVGPLREISAYGNRADEQDYRCEDCGTEWMHETGNAGYGWIR